MFVNVYLNLKCWMLSRLHSVWGVSVTGSEYRYEFVASGGLRFGRVLDSMSSKMLEIDGIGAGPVLVYIYLDSLTNISVVTAVMLVKALPS